METYFNLMSMNGGIYVFQTARKMGIFDQFRKGALTGEEISGNLGLKPRPVKLVLEALCALNLLSSEGEKYRAAPVLSFLQGNYQNLSADYWEHLPTLLQTGIPYKKMDNEGNSENEYKVQVKALEWMMKPSAVMAAKLLGLGSERKGCNIIDLGAGSAVWSLSMLQEDPSSRVDALDWPAVLEVAKSAAAEAGLSARFTALEGNFFETPIKDAEYDLAVVANVTHILTPEKNTALFKKVYGSLKEDGEIVIFDVFPGQENGELPAALYALGLGIRTEEGTVFTPEQLIGFLQKAGFSDFNIKHLKITPYTMGMLTAKK